MRTSVTVCTGSGKTSVISSGEVTVTIDEGENLNITVYEDGEETKFFYFRSGTWESYNRIVTQST